MATFDIPGDAMLTDDGTSIVLATGPERVKQRLKVAAQTFLGSYKYNQDIGLPWLDWFEQGVRVPYEAELRKFFLSHKEVDSVTSLTVSVNRTTRRLSVSYVVQLKDGAEISSTIPIAQVIQ